MMAELRGHGSSQGKDTVMVEEDDELLDLAGWGLFRTDEGHEGFDGVDELHRDLR